MFDYYQKTKVCLVHLADYDRSAPDLKACRWFYRGWTLQELLAPTSHHFYDRDWNSIGGESEIIDQIRNLTKIPLEVLLCRERLSNVSVAKRMSWAAERQTTREEDTAYCPPGIFQVNMLLIYGERARAFQRLQKEIILGNNDFSILAWTPLSFSLKPGEIGMPLLACHPSDFRCSGDIDVLRVDLPEFYVTNKGLLLPPDVPLRMVRSLYSRKFSDYALVIYIGEKKIKEGKDSTERFRPVGMPLRKVAPNLFYRHEDYELIVPDSALHSYRHRPMDNSSSSHIVLEPNLRTASLFNAHRENAVHLAHHPGYEIREAVPQRLWDPASKTFLQQSAPSSYPYYPNVIAILFKQTSSSSDDDKKLAIMVGNFTGDEPNVGLVTREFFSECYEDLFSPTSGRLESSVSLEELPLNHSLSVNWSRKRGHDKVRSLHKYDVYIAAEGDSVRVGFVEPEEAR